MFIVERNSFLNCMSDANNRYMRFYATFKNTTNLSDLRIEYFIRLVKRARELVHKTYFK